MTPGDVLHWNEFKLKRGPGPIKPRWFVYLGDNGKFACPSILFMLTPTSQTEYFKPGGQREDHRTVEFKAAPASPFIEDCILDVELDHYEFPQEHFLECKCQGIIEEKGSISKSKLLEIWRIIETSKRFSPKIKKDIRNCLVLNGILK